MQTIARYIMLGMLMLWVTACSTGAPPPAPTRVALVESPTLAPTLTPLPLFPTSTPTQISTLPTVASPTPMSGLPTRGAPASVATPTATPSPAPTNTPTLPTLSVTTFIPQGGQRLDVTIVGGQIGNLLVFRAIACNPNCRTKADGVDVDQVSFSIARNDTEVYKTTELRAPFCAFGGTNVCNYLDISRVNAVWPGTRITIVNGTYSFKIEARGKNASWGGIGTFTIKR